jgi:uncharacterized membrane protein YkvA (DUF1232 family)/ribosome biogenesis GTPase A
MQSDDMQSRLDRYDLMGRAKAPGVMNELETQLPSTTARAPRRLAVLVEQASDLIKSKSAGNGSGAAVPSVLPLVAALLYVVLPLDAIPDVVPVVGWIDDIAVLAWAMTKVSGHVPVPVQAERPQLRSELGPVDDPAKVEATRAMAELSQRLSTVTDAETRKAIESFERTSKHATEHGMVSQAGHAELLAAEARGPVTIAIIGRFNVGKSTLVNALAGCAVCPIGPVPTSAYPVFLRNSTQKQTVISWASGDVTAIDSVTALPGLKDGVIREAVVSLPLKCVPDDVWLVDTPGFSDGASIPGTSYDALARADAIVVVLDAGQPMGMDELDMVTAVNALRPGRPFLMVVNRCDSKSGDEVVHIVRFIREALQGRRLAPDDVLAISASTRSGDWERLLALLRRDFSARAHSSSAHYWRERAEELERSLSEQRRADSDRAKKLSQMDEASRHAATAAAAKAMDDLRERALRRVDHAQEDVVHGLNSLLHQLELATDKSIRSASLEQLQAGIEFGPSIQSAVEQHIQQVMDKVVGELKAGIEADFSEVQRTFRAQGFDPVLLPVKGVLASAPEIVLTGGMVVAWFGLGLLSFMGTLIAVVLARDVLKDAIKKVVGVRQRTSLEKVHQDVLRAGIRRIRVQAEQELGRRFAAMKAGMMRHASGAPNA